MFSNVFRVHEGLFALSRMPSLALPGRRVAAIEIALLILFGCGAAAMSLLPDYHLRIPGHAILRSVFPMALGLALVPRRSGGIIMGASALVTALSFKSAGFAGFGWGAVTSLCLTGPLLDLALRWAGRGWHFYFGIISAGLCSNLAALLVRGLLMYYGFGGGGAGGGGGGGGVGVGGGGGGRVFEEWWLQAGITYPVCGILAGLISAFFWFKFRTPRTPEQTQTEAKV
jgi:hypothetical protein